MYLHPTTVEIVADVSIISLIAEHSILDPWWSRSAWNIQTISLLECSTKLKPSIDKDKSASGFPLSKPSLYPQLISTVFPAVTVLTMMPSTANLRAGWMAGSKN